MIISSATSFLSGTVGNIGRLADYIDETDDFMTTLHSMTTLSVSGMNNVGFKWRYNPAFSANKNIGLLNSILPLTVSSMNLGEAPDVVNSFMNLKLMLLRYIKTHTYR